MTYKYHLICPSVSLMTRIIYVNKGLGPGPWILKQLECKNQNFHEPGASFKNPSALPISGNKIDISCQAFHRTEYMSFGN